ncbi:MAG: NUDIX hydrolase, partial [Actinomycetota bacterium]
MHQWTVAGGLVERAGSLLLVRNRRRDGRVDWSPPGGVVDPGESVLVGLGREVLEETGLAVATWVGPAYLVDVTAPDMDWHLTVEVHRADRVSGSLRIDDPDGI